MNNFIAMASAALRRLENRSPPTDTDASIVRPLLKKLIASESIPFMQRTDGFEIGTERVSKKIGLNYIRMLLQKPGTEISCRELLSLEANEKPAKGSTAEDLEFRVLEELRTSYAGTDVASSYQEALDEQAIRELKDRITLLEDARSIEALEELDFLNDYLKKNTFKGDSSKLKDEKERARQSVTNAIKNAVNMLKENPATKDVGLHLDENIKRGAACTYFGDWKWKF